MGGLVQSSQAARTNRLCTTGRVRATVLSASTGSGPSGLTQTRSSPGKPGRFKKAVQIFLTSHSPNFTALADIDSVGCIYQHGDAVETFFPREVAFEKRKKEKLQRYLNVTRAEIFFARRIILVEGAAELFMIEAMAKRLGYNLNQHAISVISADGLNFDAFMPLFGTDAMKVRIAVLSDSDEDGYPPASAAPLLSPQAKAIQSASNSYVQTFFGIKTFEYSLALKSTNRSTMLAALKEINPTIGAELETQVATATEEEKARVLFQGMFERGKGKASVQKGSFGQALAQAVLSDDLPLEVPSYIHDAFKFVCGA